MPEFSLITLTHNRLPWTKYCLSSWLHTVGGDWEGIVVENGSTDGTREWLATFRAQAAQQGVPITVLPNTTNAGCSTARNQGIEHARGTWLVFLDNDVALRTGDWLRRLRTTICRHDGAVMAGPRLVYPMPPFDTQCAGVTVSRRGRVGFRERGVPRAQSALTRVEPVQCLISACLMANAAAVRDAGGFDPVFNPVQFEDFDLCYRLRARGGIALFDPGVEMYHFESTTTQGAPSLHNPAIVVRNGLTFKRRWRQMIEEEGQAEPVERQWHSIPLPHPDTLGKLPLHG